MYIVYQPTHSQLGFEGMPSLCIFVIVFFNFQLVVARWSKIYTSLLLFYHVVLYRVAPSLFVAQGLFSLITLRPQSGCLVSFLFFASMYSEASLYFAYKVSYIA